MMLLILGERKDFEVYSCDISPDGGRLVTAAGGKLIELPNRL
jgi:protein HIRA/HIR1